MGSVQAVEQARGVEAAWVWDVAWDQAKEGILRRAFQSMTKEHELTMLKENARALREQMEVIDDRIRDLEETKNITILSFV